MLPKFSLRFALLLLTVGAMLSLVLAAAVRGDLWAVGATIAIVSALATLLIHALFYSVTKLFGSAIAVVETSSSVSLPAEETAASDSEGSTPGDDEAREDTPIEAAPKDGAPLEETS